MPRCTLQNRLTFGAKRIPGEPVASAEVYDTDGEQDAFDLAVAGWALAAGCTVERPAGPGWFLGVQWHPEGAVRAGPAQLAVVRALVRAAR